MDEKSIESKLLEKGADIRVSSRKSVDFGRNCGQTLSIFLSAPTNLIHLQQASSERLFLRSSLRRRLKGDVLVILNASRRHLLDK